MGLALVLLGEAQGSKLGVRRRQGAVGFDGLIWRYALSEVPPSDARIRLVANTEDNAYFGDAATVFINRE